MTGVSEMIGKRTGKGRKEAEGINNGLVVTHGDRDSE